ncbi:MAG: heavy-metal-associated domain-containing protein [Clostridia bacterium]|nr:heavy-metal-associated domain-containing protein [Clostridia bacterium]
MKKKIYIEGMTCEHCLNRVKNALSEMDNIKEVQVNLAEGFALIESDREIVNSALTDTIDEAGYDVTKIEDIN